MKFSNPFKYAALAIAMAAFTAPAHAKQGADDPASHSSGGHGADDPAGDNRGNPQTTTPPSTTPPPSTTAPTTQAEDNPARTTTPAPDQPKTGGTQSSTQTVTSTPTSTDDRGKGSTAEPGDDRGRGTSVEPGDDRGRGVGLEPGDDHGRHQVATTNQTAANSTRNTRIADKPRDASSVLGTLKHKIRNQGNKEEFSIQLKLRYPDASLGINSITAAQDARIFAVFRNTAGTATAECRFDFDEIDRRKAEYQVKLVRTGTLLREKEGACDVDLSNTQADPGIPVAQKGAVEIYVDAASGKTTIATLTY